MFFLFMRKLYFKKSKNFLYSFFTWARIETTYIEMTSYRNERFPCMVNKESSFSRPVQICLLHWIVKTL